MRTKTDRYRGRDLARYMRTSAIDGCLCRFDAIPNYSYETLVCCTLVPPMNRNRHMPGYVGPYRNKYLQNAGKFALTAQSLRLLHGISDERSHLSTVTNKPPGISGLPLVHDQCRSILPLPWATLGKDSA